MKIAILGGSFDPVHRGHLQIGTCALETLGCDQVWFLPSHDTPLKERQQTPANHRVAMLEIAIQDKPSFQICDIEIQREGVSYTVDTLETLTQMYPEHEFIWLIGNDQLEQFDQWKEPDRLVTMAQFVCVDRDGKLTETKYPIKRIHMTPMPVSSSEIRLGKKLNYLSDGIVEYMLEHELYIHDFVASRVNENRYKHSVSVAQLSRQMAISNGYDGHKAYLAGLFHDVAKSMSKEAMEPWMDIICPENKKYAVPVWHGFVGSEIVKRIFSIHDSQIQQAIYHHVLGTSTDPYAMIVFCADKTEPLRKYDASALREKCMENLEEGFHWIKEENEKYLRKG